MEHTCENCDPILDKILQDLHIFKMKYAEGLNYLEQLKNYVQTSLSIKQNVQQTIIDKNIKLEESADDSIGTHKTRLPNDSDTKKNIYCDPILQNILQDLQMNYMDGLNYLDQLKDYVHTSLSIKQNVQQTAIVQKVEQSEDDEQIGDPLSFREKIEGIKSDDYMEEVEPIDEYYLNVVVKEELSDEEETNEDQSSDETTVQRRKLNICKLEKHSDKVDSDYDYSDDKKHMSDRDSQSKYSDKKKANKTSLTKRKTSKKSVACDLCEEIFPCKRDMARHRKIHTGNKTFQCEICSKLFSCNSNMLIHRRMHTGEKPFKCDICNMSFVQTSHLKSHRRIHTGETFQCEFCPKSFAEKSNLVKHIRYHTGEKLFQCDICNMKFYAKHHLDSHRRTHTGEKPYQCEVCSKYFKQKSHLIVHTKIHSGVKPFKCDICDMTFTRKGSLDRHKKKHTSEENPFKCENDIVTDTTFEETQEQSL